jgi:hypothetical protein
MLPISWWLRWACSQAPTWNLGKFKEDIAIGCKRNGQGCVTRGGSLSTNAEQQMPCTNTARLTNAGTPVPEKIPITLRIVGVAAAIANAVYHATGKRVRDLPITLDKLQRQSDLIEHVSRASARTIAVRHST